MPLNFPDKPEIQLEHPPIAEVICQVKFPAILRIAKADPVDFQERVRDRFPNYEIDQGVFINAPAPGIEGMSPVLQSRVHRFNTDQPTISITLAPDFYAVSTRDYRHWEAFFAAVGFVHKAVFEVYRPSHILRIGLRYINRLTTANTACNTLEDIYDLLQPELTTQLRSAAFASPEEFATRTAVSDGSTRFTLSTAVLHEPSASPKTREPVFILDFDCYEEGRLQYGDLDARLVDFHGIIYRAFRWCVRDEALARFGSSSNVKQMPL